MSLETLKEAREKLNSANHILFTSAKSEIGAELTRLFANPSITSIQWAQKASEYNDEGMYPGVFGPVKNQPGFDEEPWPSWIDGYGYDTPGWAYDGMDDLKKVLNLLGEDILSEIFGDECRIMAVRDTGKGYKLVTEYQSY